MMPCTVCVKINDRLNINGELCTVKYIGSIPAWPNTVAYGVEWDHDRRGKNNGSLQGVTYFSTTDNRTSGSFIKEKALLSTMIQGISFEEALLMKYGDNRTRSSDIKYKFGSKETEAYGFERLNESNSNFSQLKSITLSQTNINKATNPDFQDSMVFNNNLFTSVRYLDLSFNLFSDINEVYRILTRFPCVKTLVLSGNCFPVLKIDDESFKFPQVKEISLARCKLKNNDLGEILTVFPSLEIIDLSCNFLTDLTVIQSSWKQLNISGNMFSKIPAQLLTKGSSLTHIEVSNNKITGLDGLPTNEKIESLRVDANNIQNWNEIDRCNNVFPNLRTLWVQKNPIVEPDTQANFYSTIARISSLTCVNGTPINEELRKEAELYFISQVLSGQIHLDDHYRDHNDSSVWEHLVKKHKIDTKATRSEMRPRNFLDAEMSDLTIVYGSHSEKIPILKSISVRFLKTLLRHKLHLPGSSSSSIKLQYSVREDATRHEFRYEFSPLALYNIEESTVYVNT
ncbi:protein PAC2 [Kluyveromyces marxianus]|nr:protein PAC2 [Kluyveromyces marxianus]